MSIQAGPRGKEIYVQPKTKERLFNILDIEQEKAYPPGSLTQSPPRRLTVDEIADRMLNERIEQVYPNIGTLEKRLDALTGQLRSELLNPSVEK